MPRLREPRARPRPTATRVRRRLTAPPAPAPGGWVAPDGSVVPMAGGPHQCGAAGRTARAPRPARPVRRVDRRVGPHRDRRVLPPSPAHPVDRSQPVVAGGRHRPRDRPGRRSGRPVSPPTGLTSPQAPDPPQARPAPSWSRTMGPVERPRPQRVDRDAGRRRPDRRAMAPRPWVSSAIARRPRWRTPRRRRSTRSPPARCGSAA